MFTDTHIIDRFGFSAETMICDRVEARVDAEGMRDLKM